MLLSGVRMDIYYSLQLMISGLISGAILFHTAFVAPTIFTKVAAESRAPFLRAIFPKLFKAIAGGGILFTIMVFLSISSSTVTYFVGGYTIAAGVICDLLIPATNKARDEGDNKKFAVLHKISVLATIAVLLINVGWVFV